MASVPRRRWLRFSLRTQFVVVTIFACWLGYQLDWIRERRRFINESEGVLYPGDEFRTAPYLVGLVDVDAGQMDTRRMPLGLRLLCEGGVDEICIGDAENFDRAKRLFPEAEVYMPKWVEIKLEAHQRKRIGLNR